MVFDVENDSDINKNIRVGQSLGRADASKAQEWAADEKAEEETRSSSQG